MNTTSNQKVTILNKNQRIGIVIGVSAILLVSIILLPSLFSPGNQVESLDYVKITVLVDNHPNNTLLSPWGLSILVETTDSTILFDSGPDPITLENNTASQGIDLGLACDCVVVSHTHPDHVSGFTYVSDLYDNLTMYTPYYGYPRSWTSGFNDIEIEETAEISTGVSIVGMGFEDILVFSEQALVIDVENLGLVVLVACSHPGVENIVSTVLDVMNADEVYMVIGGFHLLYADQQDVIDTVDALLDMGVQNIYPIHCSGEEINDYLETNHPDNYGTACVGFQIVLDGTADIP